ncbi:hypothetical protein [Nocardia tengchongensis]|uniref:hypothetical protein n=1 Tax=Nocardia tengchongensis TaxID=2055889 RepID=UPI00364C9069
MPVLQIPAAPIDGIRHPEMNTRLTRAATPIATAAPGVGVGPRTPARTETPTRAGYSAIRGGLAVVAAPRRDRAASRPSLRGVHPLLLTGHQRLTCIPAAAQ